MADGIVQIQEPASPNKKLDTTELTVGANTVERERMVVAGSAAVALAEVLNAAPGTSEYGVVARQGKPMCVEDFQPVRAGFQTIAELIAAQPRVFTHRDYHSRNLMVDGDRLGVLDFQDALMGSAVYDLASLLRDAYIALDETLIDELIAAYLDRMAQAGAGLGDRASFRRLFDLTSIQRNLKAAGRFVYIDRVKKNPKFLADIPRVLGYVRRNLERYPELAPLRKHLTPYVPELQ